MRVFVRVRQTRTLCCGLGNRASPLCIWLVLPFLCTTRVRTRGALINYLRVPVVVANARARTGTCVRGGVMTMTVTGHRKRTRSAHRQHQHDAHKSRSTHNAQSTTRVCRTSLAVGACVSWLLQRDLTVDRPVTLACGHNPRLADGRAGGPCTSSSNAPFLHFTSLHQVVSYAPVWVIQVSVLSLLGLQRNVMYPQKSQTH